MTKLVGDILSMHLHPFFQAFLNKKTLPLVKSNKIIGGSPDSRKIDELRILILILL